jgi:DNA-binding NarL/FixJ family response regulator
LTIQNICSTIHVVDIKQDKAEQAMKSITNDMLEEDLPPEFTRYRDEGCEHAARCLDCPFDTCLYEKPGGKERFFKSRRNGEIVKLHSEGKTTAEIAAQFKVSERTIQRVVKSFNEAKAQ